MGGSSQQVRSKEAIALVGGPKAAFEAVARIIDAFAKQTFYLGPTGSGARMKLVLNLVLGLNRAVLAEGLAYAQACGIDQNQALEVLKAGPAFSTVMDTKGEKMVKEEFTPQARLSQHLKDVRLILASGQKNEAKLPLSTLHRELLEELERRGFGALDNSAIIKAFRK